MGAGYAGRHVAGGLVDSPGALAVTVVVSLVAVATLVLLGKLTDGSLSAHRRRHMVRFTSASNSGRWRPSSAVTGREQVTTMIELLAREERRDELLREAARHRQAAAARTGRGRRLSVRLRRAFGVRLIRVGVRLLPRPSTTFPAPQRAPGVRP